MESGAPHIGIDCGGTNLRIYLIDPASGDVIENLSPDDLRMKFINSSDDLTSLILNQIGSRGKANIGCTSAGSIDEDSLIVLNSPNSAIEGEVTFARDLARAGHNVSLTNDMRAAVKGVAKYGLGKGVENVLTVTYSSGYNCAKVRDGEIITEAEFGHMPYRPGSGLFCGCGGEGHLEIFVSGNGAASMAKQYFGMTKDKDHAILDMVRDDEKFSSLAEWRDVVDAIGAKHVYQAFRANPKANPQRRIRAIQSQAITDSFGMMTSAFNPLDIIVYMGSQNKDKDLLFEEGIRNFNDYPEDYHLPGIQVPRVVMNDDDLVGVRGAVAYLIDREAA